MEARILDILEIDLASPQPEPHQRENWLIADAPWKVLGRPTRREVVLFLRPRLVPGPALLGDESDRIPFDRFVSSRARPSLALVAPTVLRWQVSVAARGNHRAGALFKLGSTSYNLSVTDPEWEERLSRFPPGDYRSDQVGLRADDRVLLTISLGEPYGQGNCCYKLVAGAIVIPRA